MPDPQTVLDLRRVIRREQPDVVHAHNWLVHSYLPLDRRSEAALILSLHDYGLMCATKRLVHDDQQCSGPGLAKCVRCAAGHYQGAKGVAIAVGTLTRAAALRRAVDLFLPVSEAVRDRCGLSVGRSCRIVPNFTRERDRRRIDDPRLELLPREPFLLVVGDVTADKGARHLAEVYKTLERPPPLVMIGRCFLEELTNDPQVMILGPWPHDLAQEALRRCLFAVVPSIWAEPFGLAALESAAAGRAVVASDIGGLPEVVIDGETGLLVAPGDPDTLRSALNRLISDRRLRARLGEAAARHAALFSADAVVPAFEDAYDMAIETRRRACGSSLRGPAATG